MRKRLLYIIGIMLLLAGCHNNNHPYLRRAEEMWGKGKYDSVQYYLVQVDSSALKGEAMYNYYWLRMQSYYVLSSLDTTKADSLLRMLERHYPLGHERAFRTRLLRVLFTFDRLKDYPLADSLIIRLEPWMKTRLDSVSWYSYKFSHKHRMGDLDSTIHYLHQAKRLKLLTENALDGSIASIYEEKEVPDSAIHYYSLAMDGGWNQHAYRHAHHILQLLDEVKDKDFAWTYLKKLREQMKRKDIRLMLDSTYPDFTQRLRSHFPTLTEKDINFCCLVKTNMSLQSLSDIFCISGNSVSRRKLRLKEKLGIDKEDSLTKFLIRFV